MKRSLFLMLCLFLCAGSYAMKISSESSIAAAVLPPDCAAEAAAVYDAEIAMGSSPALAWETSRLHYEFCMHQPF